MSFILHVNARRWRSHLSEHAAALGDVVPVAKGNGYGVGNRRLAIEAARLGADTIAVGLPTEVTEVAGPFPGFILVMTPWDGRGDDVEQVSGARAIRTVAHLDVLTRLAEDARTGAHRPAVVVELMTSVRRHGLSPAELAGLDRALLEAVDLRGWALHLPLDRPAGGDPVAEVRAWLARLSRAGLPVPAVWVSHLRVEELAGLRTGHPGLRLRTRVGTGLWLGEPDALRATGTVLDTHRLAAGDRFGYRQQRAHRAGQLVVVSGGTAHGVGLEAPKAVRGPLARARELARGTLSSAGLSLSPFSWAGRSLWFAEPPHMQLSLLWLPARVSPPARGTELDCRVRHTTIHPDAVRIE